MESSKPPRVFISYSWESDEHKEWVRYLAEGLCQVGIDTHLDQWDVDPGESFTAYMVQEIKKSNFVIVVCTPSYAEKSDSYEGGVGYEQQIVSGQLMAGFPRSKFIPILRKGESVHGPDCAIPTHFLGIAWIDFRDDAAFKQSFEDLIRVIYSKPKFARPPLGAPPDLETTSTTSPEKPGLTEKFKLNKNTIDEFLKALTSGDLHAFDKLYPPDQYEILRRRGVEQTDAGQYDSAIIAFGQAIKIKPEKPDGYYYRGGAYKDKGDFGKAIADYNKAIELSPDYSAAYLARGEAYEAKGDHDRAIADYNRVIELRTDASNGYLARGNAYKAKGDYDRAIADYSKVIELRPKCFDAYDSRGDIYWNKGDYDGAIADYTKLIEIRPYSSAAYLNRGAAHNNKGNYDQAIADYNKAIELNPDNSLFYFNRGLACHNVDDEDQALADFNKAIELNPDYAAAYYRRGIVYEKKGNYDKAVAEFRESLKKNPDSDLRDKVIRKLMILGK